jgi:hypothetical protein
MSSDARTEATDGTTTTVVPTLRPARFEDYVGIARLGAANSLRTQPFREWKRMWLDNPIWPRLGSNWPIGWVLEARNRDIVGSFMSIPMLYRFKGQQLIGTASRAWAVSPQFRGFAPWLMEEYLDQAGVDLCMMTSAGPMAQSVVNKLATRCPLGDWETYTYWLLGYGELAASKLARLQVPFSNHLGTVAGWILRLKDRPRHRLLPNLPKRFSADLTEGFDERFDAFWTERLLQAPDTLLADRSRKALSWHFDSARRDGRLWVFLASLRSILAAYCVILVKGTGSDRYARLIDYQSIEPETDLLPGLLKAALAHCATKRVRILESIGYGIPKMHAADSAAPYRKGLPSWIFYYHASNRALDSELRTAGPWDPSIYDGDASLD